MPNGRRQVVVQRVEVLVEVPAHGLHDQQQEDDGQDDRHPQADEHAGEYPAEVARAADLAVEGGPPVRPQEEEHEGRHEQHRRPERAEPERRRGVARPWPRRALVACVGVVHAEELLALEVERAHEAGVRVDQEQHDNDGEADHAAEEEPPLDLRVPGHPERDQHAGQGDRDERDDEDPVVGAEPGGTARGPGPFQRGPRAARTAGPRGCCRRWAPTARG